MSINRITTLTKRAKIVLFGDSITQLSFSAVESGWGSHLSDIYQRRADVYNRGFSGYNTDWFLTYAKTEEGIYDLFQSASMNGDSSVKLVTVFFGANDASDSTKNPRQHVPIDRFQSNLKEIASICKQYFGANLRIIFLTPPPVCHKGRLQFQIDRYGKDKATGELERTLELSGLYAQAVENVAKELDYPCLNLWREMQDQDPINWNKFLSDGLHLSREGNLFVGRRLQELINSAYPEISITPCPHTAYFGNSSSVGGQELDISGGGGVGPWHDEINHRNVDEAFQKRK